MKRFLAGLIAGVVIAAAPIAYAELTPIKLVVNGAEVTLPDAQPTVIDGRVMVPLLPFSQVAGFDVVWDEANRSVNVTTQTAVAPVAPIASAEPATKPEIPKKITVDGVDYYLIRSLFDFFGQAIPDRRIGISHDYISVDNELFPAPNYVVDGDYHRAYKSLQTLLDAGVITQGMLDAFYGA